MLISLEVDWASVWSESPTLRMDDKVEKKLADYGAGKPQNHVATLIMPSLLVLFSHW